MGSIYLFEWFCFANNLTIMNTKIAEVSSNSMGWHPITVYLFIYLYIYKVVKTQCLYCKICAKQIGSICQEDYHLLVLFCSIFFSWIVLFRSYHYSWIANLIYPQRIYSTWVCNPWSAIREGRYLQFWGHCTWNYMWPKN